MGPLPATYCQRQGTLDTALGSGLVRLMVAVILPPGLDNTPLLTALPPAGVAQGFITIRAASFKPLLAVLAAEVVLDLHGLPLPSPRVQQQLLLSGVGVHPGIPTAGTGLTAES